MYKVKTPVAGRNLKTSSQDTRPLLSQSNTNLGTLKMELTHQLPDNRELILDHQDGTLLPPGTLKTRGGKWEKLQKSEKAERFRE